MEPPIQYATASDGVSIACYTLGDGLPLVVMPTVPFSHLQLEWRIPEWRQMLEQLAQQAKLVRYDGRGTGLSERNVTDFSIEALSLDLEAVVDHLRLDRFALFGPLHSGPVAIAYAASHAERVSHLLLWCAYARSSDYYRSRELPTLRGLIQENWELFTETAAHAALGWSGESASQAAAFIRECVTPEAALAALTATDKIDVSASLASVNSPTLVLHRRRYPLMSVDVATRLASEIPGARLGVLEGTSLAPYLDDGDALLASVCDFLGITRTPSGFEAAAAGTVRTVLFTDIVGHTEMMSRLGDKDGRAVLREHERITREVLAAHGGTEVKTVGDGFMASFGSVTKAVECAITLQRAIAEREGEPLLVRVGLNAGEPIEEEGDLFGATVILASRIAAKADGGEILVSDNVRSLSAGKGFVFADRGEFVAKGFEEPVRVYEVRWREAK